MANYPSPCERCENNKNNCKHFRKCQPWLTRYKYRQKQINGYAKKVLPGSCKTEEKEKKIPKNQSPCLTCTRVKDPKNCGNKDCKEWREWFLKKWGELHNGSGGAISSSEKVVPGTVLAVTAVCVIIARTIPTADLA